MQRRVGMLKIDVRLKISTDDFQCSGTALPSSFRTRQIQMNESTNSKSLPVVGVMGSGSSDHPLQSVPLGRWLATIDVHLLTGGGSGVMQSVSRAFAEIEDRVGMIIGVIPGEIDRVSKTHVMPDGYPNDSVEIAIYTHLPYSGDRGQDQLSRNHINILSSDVVVVLPGRSGTAAEAELAVIYNKPVVAWLPDRSQITDLPNQVPVVRELEQVKQFVNHQIRILNG